jgi:hypothetical protein
MKEEIIHNFKVYETCSSWIRLTTYLNEHIKGKNDSPTT